jgi:hypothetical protein
MLNQLNDFYYVDRTVPDSVVNNNSNHLLQNPIKLSELRTWLTLKSFPEQRIRDEYDVSQFKFLSNVNRIML